MNERNDYLYKLYMWLMFNPEVFVQNILPDELLEELYYFERLTLKGIFISNNSNEEATLDNTLE